MAQTSMADVGGAFICLTGQVQRLELNSKIEKVIRPLISKFEYVEVALVLSDDSVLFTNDPSVALSPFSLESARQALLATGVSAVQVVDVQQDPNPQVNAALVLQLDKRLVHSQEQVQVRAANHLRQYTILNSCFEAMDRDGWQPEMVVRLRDDALIFKADIGRISKMIGTPLRFGYEKGTIVTSSCATWWGINDKGAFLDYSGAERYFTAPLRTYWAHRDAWVKNPETYYLDTYLKEFLFLKTSDDLVITTSRYRWSDGCVRVHARGVDRCEYRAARMHSIAGFGDCVHLQVDQ